MTHDGHRAKCIMEMARAICNTSNPDCPPDCFEGQATAAFDALNGIATVNSRDRQDAINTLEKMTRDHLITPVSSVDIFLAMSIAGDLTKPSEEKP